MQIEAHFRQMASYFSIFIIFSFGFLAMASQIPSFDERICGQDGVIAKDGDNIFCYTKKESPDHQNLRLNWKSAQKKCKLRAGGDLIARKAVEMSNDGQKFDFPLWIKNDGKDCYFLEDLSKTPVQGHCDSIYSVVCQWKGSTPKDKCPDGYRWAGLKCYRVFGDVADGIQKESLSELKNEAEKKCEKVGGKLAQVTNQLEKSTILSLVNGRSHISLVFNNLYEYNQPRIILGDNEPRPGLIVEKVDSSTLYGYVCEKSSKRPLARADNNCGGEFTSFDSKHSLCFRKVEKEKSWRDAAEFCRREDSSLPSIHSLYDNATVHLARLHFNKSLWIGFDNTESWDDGSRIVFGNATVKRNLSSSDTDNCGTMNSDGNWGMKNCNETLPFYCVFRKSEKDRKILPESCAGNSEAIKFGDSCYSESCKQDSTPLRIDSRELVNFLLTWKVASDDTKCLKIQRSDVKTNTYKKLEPQFAKNFSSYKGDLYINHEGVWESEGCENPITICKLESNVATTPTPKDIKKEDNLFLVVIILSGLLGTVVISALIAVGIYCKVFRHVRSTAQPSSEMQTVNVAPKSAYDSAPKPAYDSAPKPSYNLAPKPSYDLAPKPSYNLAPKPSYDLAPRSLPSAPDNFTPTNHNDIQDEGVMEDIYDEIDGAVM